MEPMHGRLEDSWDEPDGVPDVTSRDLTALQGAWGSISGRREAMLLVAGIRFTVRFHDGVIYMGTFELGVGPQLGRMEMRIDEGPTRHKGQRTLCLYELDGDFLRWCAGGPGRDDQLSAFPDEDDPRYLSILFRREQPV
jgi:hypothetical protein